MILMEELVLNGAAREISQNLIRRNFLTIWVEN